MPATGHRRGNLVYHWKHGWIPLDHAAALSKAKGSHAGAAKIMQKHGIGGGRAKHSEPAPGYRIEQNRHPQVGLLNSFEVVSPNGNTVERAASSRQKAINVSHKHAALEAEREASRQATLAARKVVEAKKAAFDAKLAAPLQVKHIDLEDYRARQNLRDRNRYQRVNGGKTQLAEHQLESILHDPDATASDKQRAKSDLVETGYGEAKSRLASVSDANLREALARIEASDWSKWRKQGARKVISERLAKK